MIMRFRGISLDQYEEVKRAVNWEGEAPEGGIVHLTAHDGESLRITDTWESAEAFDNFVNHRLAPGLQQLGIADQPEVEIYPLHDLFAPRSLNGVVSLA